MNPSRRTLPLAAIAAVAALAAFATSASAITPSATPLTGSDFQAGDADQDSDTANSYRDWQDVVGTAVFANDDNAQDTNIDAGKINAPDGWDYGTASGGSNPGKGNVYAAWAEDDLLAPNYFLYLAFRRQETSAGNQGNAEVSISYELNQLTNTWTNSKGSSVQCREYGDLLISFDPHPGANTDDMDLNTYRWAAPNPADVPVPDDSDPTCPHGKYGQWIGLIEGSNVQAAMNFDNGSITNHLGGDPAAATLAPGTFGEAGINLAALISENEIGTCFDYQRMQMMTRSSNDVGQNSNLQDRVGPVPLGLNNCGINVEKTGPATVEHGQQMTFEYAVTNTGTEPIVITSITDDKCSTITGPVKTGGNQDNLLDPGEVWTYTCTTAVPDHADGENPHVNTVTVNGYPDGDDSIQLTDQDTHSLTIEHPTTTTNSPPQEQTVLGEEIPVVIPEQQVLGEQARPGSARIAGRTGCVGKAFDVRIKGNEIQKVVFSIDGKRVKTVRAAGDDGRYVLRINPKRFKAGAHSVKAKVTFNDQSATPAKTLRLRFERCVREAAPQFTG